MSPKRVPAHMEGRTGIMGGGGTGHSCHGTTLHGPTAQRCNSAPIAFMIDRITRLLNQDLDKTASIIGDDLCDFTFF